MSMRAFFRCLRCQTRFFGYGGLCDWCAAVYDGRTRADA
jgi:hypothetical protein